MSTCEPKRLTAQTVHEILTANRQALLVCACGDESEYWRHALDQSISLCEFLSRKSNVRKQTPIVFYCACPDDESAVAQARWCAGQGFAHAAVLSGGARAWREAGYSGHVLAVDFADTTMLTACGHPTGIV
jgi:rhodanese-related sulfurtransferase